jgi:quercetin dioxygenase-like cupin family protein
MTLVDQGPVFRALLVDGKKPGGYSIATVKYAAGSKLKWHTHDSEQIILATAGIGILATRTEKHIVKPGMLVVIPDNEVHYHGAAEGNTFTHIAFYTEHLNYHLTQ